MRGRPARASSGTVMWGASGVRIHPVPVPARLAGPKVPIRGRSVDRLADVRPWWSSGAVETVSALLPNPAADDMPTISWFEELRIQDVPTVGGKGANLGELTAAQLP